MIIFEKFQQVKEMTLQLAVRLSLFQKIVQINWVLGIDLSKQQKLDADPKAIQQINFTGNLDRAEGLTMFFIIEEAKETVLDFAKGTVKVL